MIRIYPSLLNGTIKAPASKAYAQRLLFAASLPPTGTLVTNVPDCRDIETTIDCLRRMGCRIEQRGAGSWYVEPFPKTQPIKPAKLDFKDSATTARFALAIAAAFGMNIEARSQSYLSKRHMLPLTSRLAVRGMKFTGFSLPLEMTGRLEPGEFVFRGDEGSQFIGALMYALPMLPQDSHISISSPLTDRSFVDISLNILRRFGIEITEEENGFTIPGRQFYSSPGEISAENDWSIASAWICGGAFGAYRDCSVEVDELPLGSPQLYKDIKPLISLISQDFQDIGISMAGCPSLTTLVAAAAMFKGASVELEDVPQLKAKETNRLQVMTDIINSCGGNAVCSDSGIHARGPAPGSIPADTVIDCRDDPWIFLSFALCAPLIQQTIILKDEDCITKTYGNFFKDFESLGGKWERV
jgi:3-phosphoshikimate 1-carboxyvinyltransferase